MAQFLGKLNVLGDGQVEEVKPTLHLGLDFDGQPTRFSFFKRTSFSASIVCIQCIFCTLQSLMETDRL